MSRGPVRTGRGLRVVLRNTQCYRRSPTVRGRWVVPVFEGRYRRGHPSPPTTRHTPTWPLVLRDVGCPYRVVGLERDVRVSFNRESPKVQVKSSMESSNDSSGP